jgi:hypothetical protein
MNTRAGILNFRKSLSVQVSEPRSRGTRVSYCIAIPALCYIGPLPAHYAEGSTFSCPALSTTGLQCQCEPEVEYCNSVTGSLSSTVMYSTAQSAAVTPRAGVRPPSQAARLAATSTRSCSTAATGTRHAASQTTATACRSSSLLTTGGAAAAAATAASLAAIRRPAEVRALLLVGLSGHVGVVAAASKHAGAKRPTKSAPVAGIQAAAGDGDSGSSESDLPRIGGPQPCVGTARRPSRCDRRRDTRKRLQLRGLARGAQLRPGRPRRLRLRRRG